MRTPALDVVIGSLSGAPREPDVEIVERKGVGHSDTICDALAEEFSLALSHFYLDEFGEILHHNVDKALLRGGAARARFGGGEVLEPIDIYLAGRAVTQVGNIVVPIEELAVESSRAWLRRNLHALDPARHVRIHCLVRPGSVDLSTLFTRRSEGKVPLANDTSFGVGFAPLRPLEQFTLELEHDINAPMFVAEHPAHGEDTKIMAVRHGERVSLTVARAFVAAHVASLEAYLAEKRSLEALATRAAGVRWARPEVHVNAADSLDASAVYLTVTGTSAEQGDDGEVGRGNRANGLITPFRPMSLEALAGKNSVTHVGKLYNLAARNIAESVVANVPDVWCAECYLVSRIGAPIDQPLLANVRLGSDRDLAGLAQAVEELIHSQIAELPNLWRRIVDGSERLF